MLGWFQKRRLLRDGYVQVRGLIPPPRIEAALRAINRSLGERGLPPDRIKEMKARTFCPEIAAAPELLELYEATPARALAEAAIGRVRAPDSAQIALRFPQSPPTTGPTPHIDGMYSPDNGVAAGTIFHFTALIGIFLSDVTRPDGGNLTVWPGSHQALTSYFKEHGPETLLQGWPPVSLEPPRPLTGRAGDVVLAHYCLAHGVTPNLGPDVRYAVYFRLFHQDHEAYGLRTLTDPWGEWEGMTGVT
jgi:ectoine hydroxylase-related dioxygenase (phytanoyl-CoA dioxygenase family)